jgi:predicted anti-sigma-YlaC factor YlaD
VKCKKIKKLISKYFDGVLHQEEKDMLFSHIEQCSNCKLEFDVLSKFFNNLPEYKNVELQTSLESRIFAKIEEQQNKKLIVWKKFVPVLAPVTALVIFLITTINPCKSVNTYKESYVLYPQEDIDLAELELTNFLIEES